MVSIEHEITSHSTVWVQELSTLVHYVNNVISSSSWTKNLDGVSIDPM